MSSAADIQSALIIAVHDAVTAIALGNYAQLLRRCPNSRMTADQLRSAVRSSGRQLVPPPIDAYRKLDAVRVQAAAVPTWSIRVPMWTKEQGRSDLTLELTAIQREDRIDLELDDLHVL